MSSPPAKSELRASCVPLVENKIHEVQGRLAENLRRLDGYRQCRQIFVDPSLLLRQVRINALIDGKELLMPAAGLKDGFYLLAPFSVPFKDLSFAVTYKGLTGYGKRLFVEDIPLLEISMLVGESYAVDREGARLGDGHGFFDLAAAILGELKGLEENCQLIAAIDDPGKIVEAVPFDSWDVRCNSVVSPLKNHLLQDKSLVPSINWDALQMEQIKRMSPLWRIYQKQ